MRNLELHAAMKRYVLAGMKLVRERCAPLLEREEPTGSGNGEGIKPSPGLGRSLIRLLEQPIQQELHALPEYAALVNSLEADDVISPQIGNLVGTAFTLVRIDLQSVTDHVVIHCLEESPSSAADEQTFERYYADLEARLYATEVPQEELDLLAEFASEVLPLRLREDVEIVEVTPAHLRMALTLGLLPSTAMAGFRVPSCAIRHTWSLPRGILGQGGLRVTAEDMHLASVLRRDTTERTIAALRLFQDGWVIPVATLAHTFEPPPSGTGSSEMYPPRWRFLQGEPYRLTAAQVPEFVRLWQWLDRVGGPVDLAARRFSEARYRFRLEDQLVDLVIAAEALFGAGETQEVSYKVRLRAAAFLGTDAITRRRIFAEFKSAYDMRSAIAHGGKLTKRQRQQRQRLPLLINAMEQHLRDAIRKGLSLSRWPSTHQAWDETLLDAIEGRLTFRGDTNTSAASGY
ncbi:MAG TPA: hypothetical protein VGK54_08175 [Chloroflexota bacterium]